MSHKKYKSATPSPPSMPNARPTRPSWPTKDRARKRMDPTARTLLFGNLVFCPLPCCSSGTGSSPLFSGACTIIGVILLILALWFQFGGKGQDRWNGGK